MPYEREFVLKQEAYLKYDYLPLLLSESHAIENFLREYNFEVIVIVIPSAVNPTNPTGILQSCWLIIAGTPPTLAS
jgi:hypothetical protein